MLIYCLFLRSCSDHCHSVGWDRKIEHLVSLIHLYIRWPVLDYQINDRLDLATQLELQIYIIRILAKMPIGIPGGDKTPTFTGYRGFIPCVREVQTKILDPGLIDKEALWDTRASREPICSSLFTVHDRPSTRAQLRTKNADSVCVQQEGATL